MLTPKELRRLVLDAARNLRETISIATPGYICGPLTIELHPLVFHAMAQVSEYHERHEIDGRAAIVVPEYEVMLTKGDST